MPAIFIEMKVVEKKYLIPFILVTCCFALWGFANDITNPMVKAFSKIFRMSVTEGTLVQVAFYGGYFCMALPAALFVRRFSYKAGILMGLGLYTLGSLMFLPARAIGSYYPFLLAYFILTCGLSFLETSANPFILSMGSEDTATRRLNLAQSFNPIGSLLGMFTAMNFIQAKLNPLDSAGRALLSDSEFEAVKASDLLILSRPYVAIAAVLILVFILMLLTRIPDSQSVRDESTAFAPTVKRLWANRKYRYGVIAQFFYLGVQIMCWTFIIQYGTRVFMNEGMLEQDAEVLSQTYNIVAMAIFCFGRFICTFLLKFASPSKLLWSLALAGAVLTLGVMFIDGRIGLYCLVAVSACMSLMFPTIYGIALGGVGEDAKIGAAGLIMAIFGGSVLPPFQAAIIDLGTIAGMPAVNLSFVLPLICFVVIILYASYVGKLKKAI